MLQTIIARIPLITIILLFPMMATAVLGRTRRTASRTFAIPLFALGNLGLTFCLFLASGWRGARPEREMIYFVGPSLYFLAYVGMALVQFALLKFAARRGSYAWLASLTFPLLMLFFVRYVLVWSDPLSWYASQFSGVGSAGMFLGISYLAFRTVRMLVEVRNGVVPAPTLSEFLSFVFFSPTMSIGPITTYSTFHRSLYHPDFGVTPAARSILRICKGLAKYLFVASLLSQIAYTGLMLDGHQHSFLDLIIAAFAYYLFLYCNFSGFCDIVIGAAGLVGIQVDENFRNPLAARNVQEFWSRWHMSLSFFMRDLVFQPLSKWFIRRLGPRRVKEGMIVPTLSVFLLIGVWHGPQLNYLLFGLSHGIAVVFVVYLADFMRRHLGNEGYRRYMANPLARRVSVALTVCYVCGTHFLFANSVEEMRLILDTLR